MNIENTQKVVLYTDLLGFSDLVIRDIDAARELLNLFYNIAQDVKISMGYIDLELFLFSDFLFVQGYNVVEVVDFSCELYRRLLQENSGLDNPLLCRGGIARGSVMTQRRDEAANVTKNFIVSAALTHAVKMESLVKGQRLLLAADEMEVLSHFWNSDMMTICYDQPSLRPSHLFVRYRYKDLLWPLDLKKDFEESKVEVKSLLNIASNLFVGNYQKPKKIRDHYSETFRICMLSYASRLKFIEDDMEIIRYLVDEVMLIYSCDIVWHGFLVMIMSSSDRMLIYRNSHFLRFIKKAVISPEWGIVCAAFGEENGPMYQELHDLIANIVRQNTDM